MPLLPRLAHKADRQPLPEPRLVQAAALCWRKGAKGREVLLVTSSSGRWILPKGWPEGGETMAEAALREAWEEAGVRRAKLSRKPVGAYHAAKRTEDGDDLAALHEVYAVRVREQAAEFPEAGRRSMAWLSPAAAAERVDELGLRDILLGLDG